jgi:NitT/TauT family transport system substrate-binding protein
MNRGNKGTVPTAIGNGTAGSSAPGQRKTAEATRTPGCFLSFTGRLKRAPFFLICLLLCLTAARGAGGAETALKKAAFIPQWLPQTQFAGYYVALEKGFYARNGIDLKILPGGADKSACRMLESGRALFASIQLSTAIKKRSSGIPYLNIAQLAQKSGFLLVARKTSGINELRDLDGRKVGLWNDSNSMIEATAFFKKHGLKVRVVQQPYSVNLFLRGGVDAASAMWYNEYHTILSSGCDPDELTTFFFADYGFDFPQDGIYTLESTYRKDPELCRSFVRASLEGWKYAFEHPEESVEIMMKYIVKAHIPASATHQKWMLSRMKDLIMPAGNDRQMGRLSESAYRQAAGLLLECGRIGRIPEFNKFHKDCSPDV